jgi:glucose/arabinose dehydrogenase
VSRRGRFAAPRPRLPAAGFRRRPPRALGPALLLVLLPGCWTLQPSRGGGQTGFDAPRQVRTADVALPPGYRIEAVATGLTFPTGVAFDAQGRAHVVEAGYSYGEVWTVPRLLRIEPGGGLTEVARGRNPPWNGLHFHDGDFFVAEGGHREGGRILRIAPGGTISVLAEGLPSLGDHHTNGPLVSPDGWVYYGQGTATNSGVVGVDNFGFGWLPRNPEVHDIPCRDIVLRGVNYNTRNPLPGASGRVNTGAFVPFGTPTEAGQRIAGRVPCSGAILRVRATGGPVELVADGLRNPFGLAWGADGRLLVTDNQFDDRGSRPVWGGGDILWSIVPGTWYGWPDYHAGRPLTDTDHFRSPGKQPPGFVLAEHPNAPPAPLAVLGVHSSSNGFDVSRNPGFGHVGQAFIAQFGDMAPDVGKVMGPVGYKVIRVDPATGTVHDFAANGGPRNGPASRVGGAGLERPVAARFNPAGDALYLVDFGVMTVGARGPEPRAGTGVLWRISR